MNCKQGDLAIHIGGKHGARSRNAGKVVKCIVLLGKIQGWEGVRWGISGSTIIGTNGSFVHHVDDAFLRPLRNSDDEDEILRLVGKPRAEHSK